MSDPRRFFGRKASVCRKCGSAHHYVNRLGGVVCERCDPPSDKTAPGCVVRLVCVDGLWDDPENPIDPASLQRASNASAQSGGPVRSSAASASRTTPDVGDSAMVGPDGRWTSEEYAVGFMAAQARRSATEWILAMDAVFTTPEREAEFGWFDPADWYSVVQSVRSQQQQQHEGSLKHVDRISGGGNGKRDGVRRDRERELIA